jgi:hypothetical protein
MSARIEAALWASSAESDLLPDFHPVKGCGCGGVGDENWLPLPFSLTLLRLLRPFHDQDDVLGGGGLPNMAMRTLGMLPMADVASCGFAIRDSRFRTAQLNQGEKKTR